MMNQEDIFKKIGQILNELQDQYEFLARNPGQLSELELELFLANANFLSDHVEIVKKINSSRPLKTIPEHTADPSPVVAPQTPKEHQVAAEKTLDELDTEYAAANEAEPALRFQFNLNDEPSTDKFEFEEQSIDNIFDRPLSKEEEAIIARKQKLREQAVQQPVEEAAPQSPFSAEEKKPEPVQEVWPSDQIAEKVVPEASTEAVTDKVEEKIVMQPQVQQAKPTLNDLLAGKTSYSTSLNEENNKTTIANLKQAISMNQKLLFIKDLFNGYNLAYGEVIDLIDKMPDFKTADAYLQHNYAIKNNWASKQSTVDQFYELLNQRFPAK